jgi:hypothetical protein
MTLSALRKHSQELAQAPELWTTNQDEPLTKHFRVRPPYD